ncbi:MAG: UbiH/UbiF/VisC/COQ6 family ubiquinone biosynthesis hydroxylase [Pseudomonadota bacterium]
MKDHFDICIIGGGLAGGLASLALSDAGFSCAVIDSQNPKTMRDAQFDGRTTAIAYANARMFTRLGLWERIAPYASPINDILVTDGRADTRFRRGHVSALGLHFDSSELETGAPLGWIVENVGMRNVIFDEIADNDNIALFAPARRTKLDISTRRAVVTLDDGREVSADLLVAADGKKSQTRAEAGLKVTRWSYGQMGIVATVSHDRPHKGVAQEFFLPSGPFAILPMTGDRSSLVWTEKSDQTPAYLSLDNDDFTAEVASRFGPYLGDVRADGPRFAYPLGFHLSQRLISPRIALIGDAARAVHPIAGQGFNLGIKDIAALTDVLTEARGVGLNIGAHNVLENYQSWRRFDSVMLALGTDVLNRIFSNDLAPLRAARDIGAGVVNQIGPLRRFFMRQAGADVGRLPSLIRP